MDFKEALRDARFSLHLKSDTKEGIIRELVAILGRGGKLKDRKGALAAVLEREKKMSTGMQNGVAIPHAKMDSIDDLVVAVGLKKEGVDFDALDGEPSRIFVLTLSSALLVGPHVQFLAEVGKLLGSEDIRARLLEAGSTDEMLRILTE
jgi:PTS system nitrogen regulatory IIA component